ncbi:MAG: iron-sulfur cluster assembly scaffold protein [Peptococcaceae bacterium]|nr:iron-sulfur cluster assembly scaffold protein [Candidatus Syntrophopropionicum ammoniitolerans]
MEEHVEKEFITQMQGEYSETAINHARNPHNVGNIPKCDGFAQATGICGDTLAIWLRVKDGRIALASFWTDGCGASLACGSITTVLAKDRTIEEAMEIDQNTILEALGGLPEDHVHCAELAAETLDAAIKDYIQLAKFPWKRDYMNNK